MAFTTSRSNIVDLFPSQQGFNVFGGGDIINLEELIIIGKVDNPNSFLSDTYKNLKLFVQGRTILNGTTEIKQLTVNQTLDISGDTFLRGNVTITGTLTFPEKLSFRNNKKN